MEEADEAVLWLELLTESGIAPKEKTQELLSGANELAIFTASQQTARGAVQRSFKLHNYPLNYSILR